MQFVFKMRCLFFLVSFPYVTAENVELLQLSKSIISCMKYHEPQDVTFVNFKHVELEEIRASVQKTFENIAIQTFNSRVDTIPTNLLKRPWHKASLIFLDASLQSEVSFDTSSKTI